MIRAAKKSGNRTDITILLGVLEEHFAQLVEAEARCNCVNGPRLEHTAGCASRRVAER